MRQYFIQTDSHSLSHTTHTIKTVHGYTHTHTHTHTHWKQNDFVENIICQKISHLFQSDDCTAWLKELPPTRKMNSVCFLSEENFYDSAKINWIFLRNIVNVRKSMGKLRQLSFKRMQIKVEFVILYFFLSFLVAMLIPWNFYGMFLFVLFFVLKVFNFLLKVIERVGFSHLASNRT